jgi:hypothetical protein
MLPVTRRYAFSQGELTFICNPKEDTEYLPVQ